MDEVSKLFGRRKDKAAKPALSGKIKGDYIGPTGMGNGVRIQHLGVDDQGGHHYRTQHLNHIQGGQFAISGTVKSVRSKSGQWTHSGPESHTSDPQITKHIRAAHKAFQDEAKGPVSKMKQNKMKYCKQHEKFDDCCSTVAKAKDDGIHHLTGTSRVNSSLENRGTGMLVPLVMGTREFDGTPMMGSAPGAAMISEADKMGSTSGAKPVAGSGITQAVPGGGKKKVSKADESDPFEISKSKDTKVIGKAPEGYTPTRSVTTQIFPGIHGAIAGKKGQKFQAASSETGGSLLGAAGGAIGGAAAGAIARRPALGASIGGNVGALVGAEAAGRHLQANGDYKPTRGQRKKMS